MIRISLPYILNLSASLEPLGSLAPTDKREGHVYSLWNAQSALEGLLNGSVFSEQLRSSRQLAKSLLDAVKLEIEQDWAADLSHSALTISGLFTQLRTALTAEMGTFPAYFVSQKGSFDTITLLDQPWRLFPFALWVKVPEAQFDVAEAGKALCYDMPTSCGYHIFRAVESVLRRYYTITTDGAAQPKVRNLAVYINALRQRGCADEKVLGVLSHLSKLHRNPLIHPDVVLTLDEAISLIGMAHSAMTEMLKAIPDPPTTTTSVANQVDSSSKP